MSKHSPNNVSSDNSDEIQTPLKDTSTKVDAFKFLMDSRHKTIGRNSPGKEKQESESSPSETFEQKEKLKNRKLFLEEWTEKKGRSKQKYSDEARGKQITKKLDKRAKRLKAMLSVGSCNDSKSQLKHETSSSKTVITDSDSSDSSWEIFPRKKSVSEKKRKHVFKSKQNSEKYFSENNSNTEESPKQDTKQISTRKNRAQAKLTVKDQTITTNENNPKLNSTNRLSLKKINDELSPVILKTKDETTSRKRTRQLKLSDSKEQFPSSSNSVRKRPWKMKVRLIEKENLENEINELNYENEVIALSESDDAETYSNVISKQISPDVQITNQRATKLAPIFLQSQKKQSSVDSQLKKDSCRSVSSYNSELEESIYCSFPTISHVEQRTSSPFWHLPIADLPMRESFQDSKYDMPTNLGKLNGCFECNLQNVAIERSKKPVGTVLSHQNIENILEEMQKGTEYPVKRMYQMLKELSEVQHGYNGTETDTIAEENVQVWTDKYNPFNRETIVGNKTCVDKLAVWLESWLVPSNKRTRYNSDSCSSGDDFRTGQQNDEKAKPNISPDNSLVLLIGAHGIGKTSTVYALCEQLGLTVIEVNASSRRSGKKLLQDIQEATRSHRVQSDTDTPLSLLLVEDADVVFENQDEGFVSALKTLARTSLRPIVLTATDPNCEHLRSFIDNHQVLRFTQPSENDLVLHMQLLCLVECVSVPREVISVMVARNDGDVRRTMLELQFWTATSGNFAQLGLPHLYSNLGALWWSVSALQLNPKRISDRLAFADVIYKHIKNQNNDEPTPMPWCSSYLIDSLSVIENLEEYNDCNEGLTEIMHWILQTNINMAKEKRNTATRAAPTPDHIRWRKNMHIGYTELNKTIPLGVHLDRRGLAVDYQPALRQICRLEANRHKSNRKRGNRFYHYLRGADVQLPGDVKKVVCRTFSHSATLL